MTRRDPVARLRNSLEVFQIPQNSSLSSPASSTGRCRACAQAGREPMALRVSPRPCPSRARAPTTANQTLEPGIRRDPETVADLSSRAALTVGTLRSLLMEWTSTALTPARSPSLHGRCPRRRSAAASLQGNSTVEHASRLSCKMRASSLWPIGGLCDVLRGITTLRPTDPPWRRCRDSLDP